jgi:integrase
MRGIVRKETYETPAELAAKARHYAGASLAPITLALYQRKFQNFTEWCDRYGRASLPAGAETVALFLVDIADRYRPRTVGIFLTAIARAHRAAGLPFDRTTFDVVLQGIRRTFGVPRRESAPLTVSELRAIAATLPNTLSGARDRALLTLGFAAALRPSELVGLDIGRPAPSSVGAIEISREGVRLSVRRPQVERPPIVKAVPRGGSPCPVEALERWLDLAGIVGGAVFRQITPGGALTNRRAREELVRRRVKHAVRRNLLRQGMSRVAATKQASLFSGHSLRAGFVVSALAAGASSESIARHVGWLSTQMVASYRRNHGRVKNHPVERVLGS